MNTTAVSRLCGAALALSAAVGAASCGLVNDDLPVCRHEYRLRFKYDCNLNGGDAFASQVTDVRAWLYDSEGRLAAVASDRGEALRQPGYSLPIEVEPGVYDAVVWCGLTSGASFTLTARGTEPAMTDLGVGMTLTDRSRSDRSLCSNTRLSPLFHGMASGVELTAPEGEHSVQYVDISLVKDNKNLAVTLVQIDGTPIGRGDFNFAVEAGNSLLGWNNDVIDGPSFDYLPCNSKTGTVSTTFPSDGSQTGELHAVMAEFSMNRLMAGRRPQLSIRRTSDGKEVARIDLVKYFLWEKSDRYSHLSPQEYLDRREDYSLMLFVDSDHDWYQALGIFINGWATVPTQEVPFRPTPAKRL